MYGVNKAKGYRDLVDELDLMDRVAEELSECAELLRRRAQRAKRVLVEFGSGSGSGEKAA